MKKLVLALSLIVPFFTNAQITLLSDSFDTYTAGNYVSSESGGIWSTWSGNTQGSEDALVSNSVASSNPNSIHIFGTQGPMDVWLPFPNNYTSGVIRVSMKMYTDSAGGYFNLQETTTPGDGWMIEVFMDNTGAGSMYGGGDSATFTYAVNQWVDFRVVADLNNDTASLYVAGAHIITFPWSPGALGNGESVSIGGLNLFAFGLNNVYADYYVDDVLIEDISPAGINDPQHNVRIALVPNPSNGQFSLLIDGPGEGTCHMQIRDLVGKTIITDELPASRSVQRNYQLDVPAGIYLLTLAYGNNQVTSQRLVVVK